jgi:protein-histidine pros-kinase
MKKLLKFNLIFLPLLAVALGSVAYVARGLLQDNARDQIQQIARLIMETASSSRTYTTKQVAPLLQHKNFKLQEAIAEFKKTLDELPKDADPSIPKDVHYNSAKRAYLLGQKRVLDGQQQLIDSVRNKPEELLDVEFHPQSVPAFAATEISHYLNEKYPDYTYKEATLNPTNPRDRSTDWETDVINQFRKVSAKTDTEYLGHRSTPVGEVLVLARPLKVSNVSCLTCHSTPDKAPPEMRKVYGDANGFNWTLNDIIGAQVVTVPMSVPLNLAEAAWGHLTTWLAYSFIGIALCANLGAVILVGSSPRTFTP